MRFSFRDFFRTFFKPKPRFLHRDLSWLDFNERVLGESFRTDNPVLERVKFISISASNLDEFFMIRYSTLKNPEHGDIRRKILKTIGKFSQKQMQSLDLIKRELLNQNVVIWDPKMASESMRLRAKRYFSDLVSPALLANGITSFRNLKNVQNLQLFVVIDANDGDFSGVMVSKDTPSLFRFEDPDLKLVELYFLDDLILEFGLELFADLMGVGRHITIFRLTKDGDIHVDIEHEDTESIPDAVKKGVQRRDRNRPIRIQMKPWDEKIARACAKAWSLPEECLVSCPQPMTLHRLWGYLLKSTAVDVGALGYPKAPERIPQLLMAHAGGTNLFTLLNERDVLLHHPYDSFEAFMILLRAAAHDPDVTKIEMTIYRTDSGSPIIVRLKEAAKAGKEVKVYIELRARFDELNNIQHAESLRASGIEVVFASGKLKLHAKTTLITRKEKGGLRYYSHFSTGNYHSVTARQYTDLALLTANQDMGLDARKFLDAVESGKVPVGLKRLVPAPTKLHQKLKSLIKAEISAAKEGRDARIFVKVNALVDQSIISELYLASQAGVKIDLIVRGPCALVPGIRGLSDRISVISIVDRYLEHSRVYYFGSKKTVYLSSADWMPRNFFSRFEIAFPILDSKILEYFERVLIPIYVAETERGHQLNRKGRWLSPSLIKSKQRSRAQWRFSEISENRYKDTPLESH